jgi:hypothetical protein
MGDVVEGRFGRKRPLLSGFLPENLGMDALDRTPTDCGEHLGQLGQVIQAEQERAELFQAAKQGGPIISILPPRQSCQGCASLSCRDCQGLTTA